LGRRALAGQKNDFNYFERLPFNFNEKLFQYNYADFAYSNVILEEEVKVNSNNLYQVKKGEKQEIIFLY